MNVLFIFLGHSLKETSLKRNPESPVKNCPKVSLIYLSQSVRRGLILIDCDIYWGLIIRDLEDFEDPEDSEEIDGYRRIWNVEIASGWKFSSIAQQM